MQKPEAFFVISRYKEDVSWIKNYTDNYLIFDKGNNLGEDFKAIKRENTCGNVVDIFRYVHEYYDSLPPLICFIQANPFPHCCKDCFSKLIYNTEFTNICCKHVDNFPRNEDGTYNERVHICNFGIYNSYDSLMNTFFTDYKHIDFVTFAPGAQYIVKREPLLKYPKKFWGVLSSQVTNVPMREEHGFERATTAILNTTYNLKEEYK